MTYESTAPPRPESNLLRRSAVTFMDASSLSKEVSNCSLARRLDELTYKETEDMSTMGSSMTQGKAHRSAQISHCRSGS
jgi:hypothetical protein